MASGIDTVANVGIGLIILVVVCGAIYYYLSRRQSSGSGIFGLKRETRSSETVVGIQNQMMEIEINTFIDDAMRKGYSKEQIKEHLIQQGRPADMIDRQLKRS